MNIAQVLVRATLVGDLNRNLFVDGKDECPNREHDHRNLVLALLVDRDAEHVPVERHDRDLALVAAVEDELEVIEEPPPDQAGFQLGTLADGEVELHVPSFGERPVCLEQRHRGGVGRESDSVVHEISLWSGGLMRASSP